MKLQSACQLELLVTVLSTFPSTYAYKSCNRSNLIDETNSSCISQKVTKYKPNVKSLSAVMQQQKSHGYSTRKAFKAFCRTDIFVEE